MNQCALMLRLGLALLLVSVLSACASGKIVKTYEGADPSLDQLAVLIAPKNIRVIAVDGVKMPTYMLSGIVTEYGLLPGEHLIEFDYESVWATSKADEEGRKSKSVVSESREAAIKVLSGQKLTFRFVRPENVKEAEHFATNFTAEIVDAEGRVVAVSADKGSFVASPTVASERPASDSVDLISAGEAPLEALKALWSSASEEDRKSFLKWAFQ